MMTHINESSYINAFNCIPGIGPQKLYKLSQYFDSFASAWHADAHNLSSCGFSHKLVDTVIKYRMSIDVAHEWQKCIDHEITLISIFDAQFPKKLKTITNPPFCLYVRGNIDALVIPSVAIVGSRKVSEYGTHATHTLAGDIARADISIVSGLALGTDAHAHKAALENAGVTVAVLGGGIDDRTITPHSHITLAQRIIKSGGALVSEYPCGTEPHRGTFPQRNRIMAGLTDATIIIEAAQKSGTLITAAYAQKYKRTLFVVPGSIFSENARGSNMLIRDNHAQIVLSSADVLSLFHKKQPHNDTHLSFKDKNQETIYHIMTKSPDGIHINQLIKKSTLDTTSISSTLTMLEIDGIIKNIGNQIYIVQK